MPDQLPRWLTTLTEEELHFLKRFLLHSGSLKALAAEFSISYPTVRARLDRLIAKVESAELPESQDAFERLLHLLVEEGVLVPGTARSLNQAHKRVVADAAQRAERHVFASLRDQEKG